MNEAVASETIPLRIQTCDIICQKKAAEKLAKLEAEKQAKLEAEKEEAEKQAKLEAQQAKLAAKQAEQEAKQAAKKAEQEAKEAAKKAEQEAKQAEREARAAAKKAEQEAKAAAPKKLSKTQEFLEAVTRTIGSIPYKAAPAAGVTLHPAALISKDARTHARTTHPSTHITQPLAPMEMWGLQGFRDSLFIPSALASRR